MDQFNEISELEADNIEIQNFFKSKKKLYNPVLFNIINQIEEKQKPINMDASNVKKFREELGLSQQKFADQIGVDRRTVVNWEKGNKIPDSKIKLFKLMSINNKSEMVSESPIEKFEDKSQTVVFLNREIVGLNDHIKSLKESIVDKILIADMYKSENTLLKEKLAGLDK